MAKNRDPVKPVESESESGEENGKSSSGEVDSQESDSESEQTQTAMQNNSAAPPPQPPQFASFSEEEESGSEAESESEGVGSVDSPVASNGGRSTPTSPLFAKRRAEYTASPSEDAKKAKTDDSEASGIGSVVRKTPKRKLNLSESEEENYMKDAVVVGGGGGELSLFSGESSLEEKMLIMGRELFEAGLGIEGENEWRKMKVMEWELNLRKLQVKVAQTKLVLGGLKAEDH